MCTLKPEKDGQPYVTLPQHPSVQGRKLNTLNTRLHSLPAELHCGLGSILNIFHIISSSENPSVTPLCSSLTWITISGPPCSIPGRGRCPSCLAPKPALPAEGGLEALWASAYSSESREGCVCVRVCVRAYSSESGEVCVCV